MNPQIKSWLSSSRDYSLGVDLYTEFGNSHSLKRILRRSEPSEDLLATMVHELSLLDGIEAEPQRIKARHQNSEKEVSVSHSISPAPANLSEDALLFAQIKEKLKYRDLLHASLSEKDKTLEQRKEAALLILDISDKITDEYERYDHFKKHGVLPPDPVFKPRSKAKPIEQLSPVELEKRKNNIRSKISFYKNKVADPHCEGQLKHNQACLAAWKKELSGIIKLLQ